MSVKKAIIPIAGKGTRFLPATKEIPKEMIPIINVPMIHYIVKEAKEAGIETVIFITASNKESIENYFDINHELEAFLKEKNKFKELALIEEISQMIDVVAVRQKTQLGLGHAILCAEHLVKDEPFAVLLGDDLIFSKVPAIKQLMEVSAQYNNSSVIGVMEVPKEETNKYGIVDGNYVDDRKQVLKMNKMVEKPKPEDAPTQLATPGRYILTPKIFEMLRKIKQDSRGEYQLTDAINLLCQNKSENVYASLFEGDRFDTGTPEGYLEATVELALKNREYGDRFFKFLKQKLENYSKDKR